MPEKAAKLGGKIMVQGPYGVDGHGGEARQLTECDARLMVEAQYGRKLDAPSIGRGVIFGFGAFVVLYLLNAIGMASVSGWICLGVGSAVGAGFFLEAQAKQRAMRADLRRLLKR